VSAEQQFGRWWLAFFFFPERVFPFCESQRRLLVGCVFVARSAALDVFG